MNDDDYVTMSELGPLFGTTSHQIGKTLKVANLRTPTGNPTLPAIERGLTRRFEGPKPWIPLWKWHKEKILFYLEYYGLRRVETAANGSDK